MFILSEKVSGRRTRNRRFERSRVTLGSDLICQIWIPDSGAAGVHAEITESEGKLRLRVMDKAPSVQVNNTIVREAHLSDGDCIRIGSAEFRITGPLRVSGISTRFFLRIGWCAVGFLVIWQGVFLLHKGLSRRPPLQRLEESSASKIPVPDPPMRPVHSVPETISFELPVPPPQPPPEVDNLDEQAKRTLSQAQAQIAQGKLAEADLILSRMQSVYSDYLPAYAERATLFERRGLRDAARYQWMEILQRATDTENPATGRAAAALARLALQDFPKHPPPAPPDPVLQPTVASSPVEKIRILSTDMRRLPETLDSDEVRILQIQIELERGSPAIRREDVEIRVTFYDRTEHDGRVRPSQAKINSPSLALDGSLWTPPTVQQVTATYVIPHGFRRREQQTLGGRNAYFGFAVEVLVRNTLKARLVKPAQLETITYGRR